MKYKARVLAKSITYPSNNEVSDRCDRCRVTGENFDLSMLAKANEAGHELTRAQPRRRTAAITPRITFHDPITVDKPTVTCMGP